MPPDTLVLALSAKRPKPPPVSGLRPAQRSVSRSEAESAAIVPSIFSVGRALQLPSKASFTGAPLSRTLRPERSPASAAAKSDSVIAASIGSSCQTKRPVAAKLLEIDGQASASSTLPKLSDTPRAASLIAMVPSSTRISVNVVASAGRLALGPSARARVSISAAQLVRPSGPKVTLMRGRNSTTSAISTRPTNSGKNRSRAVSRSAASAGSASSPSATLAKLIEPVGNSETDDIAAQHQIESGDVADFGLGGLAHAARPGSAAPCVPSTATPSRTTAAMAIPRRLKPVAAVTDRSSRSARRPERSL